MQPSPEVNVFWTALGRLVLKLLRDRAHVQIIITLRDGVIQPVAVNRTFPANNLPTI